MKKSKVIVVRYKSGSEWRRFSSALELGKCLFSALRWRMSLRVAFKRLRLSRTLVHRAASAYIAWLVGTSRTRR